MDIYGAERLAQDMSLDPKWDKSFLLVGPGGIIKCKWLDPYFGMFTTEGSDGFMMTKNIPEGIDVIMPLQNADQDAVD